MRGYLSSALLRHTNTHSQKQVVHSEQEWRELLPSDSYRVLREVRCAVAMVDLAALSRLLYAQWRQPAAGGSDGRQMSRVADTIYINSNCQFLLTGWHRAPLQQPAQRREAQGNLCVRRLRLAAVPE